MTRICADVLHLKGEYIDICWGDLVVLCSKAKWGIEAQMVREWKMWNKKRGKKKESEEERRNTRLILVSVWLQMVVEEFVRSARSIIERFLRAVFLLFMLSVYVCMSLSLCLYLLKNANEKKINANEYKNSFPCISYLSSLFY